MKFLKEADVKNKVVLVREDLNSEVVKGRVLMAPRIKESANTINHLRKRKAKVVVIAHQGRPGEKEFTSLEQHAKLLGKFTKIKFVPDVIGKKAEDAIKDLKPGQAILLDNIRKLKDEFSGSTDTQFVKKLSSWCDIYVNDAFSVSHRVQASVVAFPKKMKHYAGLLMEKEVKALEKINLKSCLYILAGAKPDDNFMLLNKNKILACGLFGQMCIVAKGRDLGAQNKYLENNITNYDKWLGRMKIKLNKIGKLVKTPVDFAVRVNNKRKDVPLQDFPVPYEIFDIGPETQKMFVKEIKDAKAIYMKGPAGYYSEKQFFHGTYTLLKAISKSSAFSVLGGGQLSDAIAKSKIPARRFGHISLSGGALLEYIAGKKLPGLKTLGFYRK